MGWKEFTGLFFLGLCLIILNSIMMQNELENATMTTSAGTSIDSALNEVSSFQVATWFDILGVIKIPIPNSNFFDVALKFVSWDYSVFGGSASYLRYFLLALSAGVAFGMFIMFISAIQGRLGSST